MAIVTAGPVPGTTKVTPIDSFNMKLVEDWLVQTDDTPPVYSATDPLFFIGDPLFPAIGSVHGRNSAFRFQTFSQATQQKTNQWMFSGMQYSTWQRPVGLDFRRDAFIDELIADRSWAHSAVSKIATRGYVADPTGVTKFVRPVSAGSFSTDPEPIATKEVGEPITGVTETKYIPVCHYVRNELAPPAALVTGGLVGAVNSDAITVDGLAVPAQTCLIQDISVSNWKSSLQESSGTQINFRTIAYQLAINEEGWDLDLLNAGYYSMSLDPASLPAFVYKPARITMPDGWDKDGNKKVRRPASSPQLIDIDGKQIITDPTDADYVSTWRDDIHYRVFRIKKYVAFAGFNFS